MKTCGMCKQAKALSEFNVNRAKKDGLQTSCRECNKTHAKGYYEKHKERLVRQIKTAYKHRCKDNLAKVRGWKADRGCSRCPERDPVALDFHHPENNKEFAIAHAVSHGTSWKRLETEMLKCVILCANCHRKHHHASQETDH